MKRSELREPSARGVLSATTYVALAVVALLILPGASYAKPRTTAEVLQHHVDFFCPDDPADPIDLDRFMEDYHKRAVLIIGDNTGAPPSVAKGRKNVRASFGGLFAAVGNACDLVVLHYVVDGQYAYIQWVWPEFGGLAPGFDAFGTDTFLIKGGQIRLQAATVVFTPSAP
jgi:hypothetical protein